MQNGQEIRFLLETANHHDLVPEFFFPEGVFSPIDTKQPQASGAGMPRQEQQFAMLCALFRGGVTFTREI